MILLFLLWVVVTGLVLLIGRYPKPGFTAPGILLADELGRNLLVSLRLPRVVAGAFLGLALGGSGAVLQMLFGNPLVEPGLVGVSQGSAFGAAVALVVLGVQSWGFGWLPQLLSTVGGFAGLMAAYGLARRIRFGGWVLRMVLAGIAVSALFSAGVGLIKLIADPITELPALTFWLLGGLWAISWPQLIPVAALLTPSLLLLLLFRWRINLLALPQKVSFSLGVPAGRERVAVLIAATAAVSAVVAVSGIVAWVGLLVPHIARRLVPADARYSLPASMLLGALLVELCDALARTLLPGEIPLGIVTSLVGAALFLYLLTTRRVTLQRT